MKYAVVVAALLLGAAGIYMSRRQKEAEDDGLRAFQNALSHPGERHCSELDECEFFADQAPPAGFGR